MNPNPSPENALARRRPAVGSDTLVCSAAVAGSVPSVRFESRGDGGVAAERRAPRSV